MLRGLALCAPPRSSTVTTIIGPEPIPRDDLLRPPLQRRGTPNDPKADRPGPHSEAQPPVAQAVRVARLAQAQRRAQGHELPGCAAAHAGRWPHPPAAVADTQSPAPPPVPTLGGHR